MITKTKTIYENLNELKAAIKDGAFHIGDEFITEDIDGKAKFVIAHADDNYVYFVRKNLLKGTKPVESGDFSLFDWLNEDYLMSMPEDLRKEMEAPAGQQAIDLPKEIQVFGKNEYGIKEDGEQWEYFKKCKNRIAVQKSKDEYSHWWWMGTPEDASAAYFCICNRRGDASCYHASNAGVYVRPRFILAK